MEAKNKIELYSTAEVNCLLNIYYYIITHNMTNCQFGLHYCTFKQ